MTASSNKKLPLESERKKKAKQPKSVRAAQSGRVRRSDILVLEENTEGKDIIIGDVHGAKLLLQKLIDEKLNDPNNRLFIVGDLIDRGEDSLGVIQLIQQLNKKRKEEGLAEQIYVVRGNHEDQLLRLCELSKESSQEWRAHCRKVFFNNGGAWIEKADSAQLAQAVKFVKTLPYIIHVQGARPFHIVHADMPMNDFVLQDKIKQGGQLQLGEKIYATLAREKFSPVVINTAIVGRTPYSAPAFCGHSVVTEITKISSGRQRVETNMINLDGMACFTGAFLTVELSQAQGVQCQLFGSDQPITSYYRPIDKDEQIKAKAALKTVPMTIEDNLKIAYKNHKKATSGFEKYDAVGLDQYIRNSISLSNPEAVDAKSKKLYIEKLRQVVDYLSPEKKQGFAQYLIQNLDKHMLAKERHWFRWQQHSIETRSMHIALNLLGEVKHEAGKFVVQGAAQDEPAAQTSYELTRHVKLFK